MEDLKRDITDSDLGFLKLPLASPNLGGQWLPDGECIQLIFLCQVVLLRAPPREGQGLHGLLGGREMGGPLTPKLVGSFT